MKDCFADRPVSLTRCDGGYSFFFDLIRPEWVGDRPVQPLHRICSLMRKMGVKSLLREELLLNEELEEEHRAAEVRCGGHVNTTATRISFFRSCPASLRICDINPEDFLGYAVIVRQQLPDQSVRAFILEAVIRPPTLFLADTPDIIATPVTNYYLHCVRRFEATLGHQSEAVNFPLDGSFFCQQNDLTHVCAHAALRMAFNSSPRNTVGKLSNSRINQVLGIDHTSGKRLGHYHDNQGGLDPTQIEAVVQTFGFDIHQADFDKKAEVNYAEYIYPLVESGCPVILVIDRPEFEHPDGSKIPPMAHAVAVLGHTMNSDRWSPEARVGYAGFRIADQYRYHSSAEWADHFIMSDDNVGVYVTLATDALLFNVTRFDVPVLNATMAIGIVPRGAEVPGFTIEQAAASAVWKLLEGHQFPESNRWFARLKEGPAVCRTLMQEKEEYLRHLDEMTDNYGNAFSSAEKAKVSAALPNIFWLVEISLSALYTANKSKIGEVIIGFDVAPEDLKHGAGIALVRLPGAIWYDTNKPPTDCSLMGHCPLLRRGAGMRPLLEW